MKFGRNHWLMGELYTIHLLQLTAKTWSMQKASSMAAQDLMTALQLACVNEGWLELWRVWGGTRLVGQANEKLLRSTFWNPRKALLSEARKSF